MIVVSTKANGPFFAASANSSLHNVRVRTSMVLGNAHMSKVCATSPRGSPATAGFSSVACSRILGHNLGIVSLATAYVYGRGGLPVMMFSVSATKGLGGMVDKRRVNAIIRG